MLRSERFKTENVILVGVVPGPHEPSTYDMNRYLEPLVDDLLSLYNGQTITTPQHPGDNLLMAHKIGPDILRPDHPQYLQERGGVLTSGRGQDQDGVRTHDITANFESSFYVPITCTRGTIDYPHVSLVALLTSASSSWWRSPVNSLKA